MAITMTHLITPVTAKVTQNFGFFQESQQVVIDRVAPGRKALMLGIKDERAFLPRTHVNKEAQEEIIRQYDVIRFGEYPSSSRDPGIPVRKTLRT